MGLIEKSQPVADIDAENFRIRKIDSGETAPVISTTSSATRAIEIDMARVMNGMLTVYGSSDWASGAFMTVSVDGTDFGSDLAVDPFVLEAPMTWNNGRYEFMIPAGMDLRGRRVMISTDEGGAYNSYIE